MKIGGENIKDFKIFSARVFILISICILPTFAEDLYPQYPPPPPEPTDPIDYARPGCDTYCGSYDMHIGHDESGRITYFQGGDDKVWDGKSSYPNCKCKCKNGNPIDELGGCGEYIKNNQNNPTQECKDRPDEHLKAVPNTYPDCQWVCEDGYGMVEGGICKKCSENCAIVPHSIPDLTRCVGGICDCICDSAKGYSFNEQGKCACQDGYGTDGDTCKPCAEICEKDNKIPSPKSVGGTCHCICDIANGYYLDPKTGICANDLDAKLIQALNARDNPAKVIDALVPYLESDNQKTRILAYVGIVMALKGAKEKKMGYLSNNSYLALCSYSKDYPEDKKAIMEILSHYLSTKAKS